MKKLFLLSLFATAVLSANALTFTVDDIEYTTMTSSQVAITGGTRAYIGVYPTVTYNGKTYDIWCIADEAFKNSTTVEYLNIDSENFVYIGRQAFMGCTNLKSIEFEKVASQCQFYIDQEAFYGCNNSQLTYVSLPPEGVMELYPYAFRGCTSLRAVNFYDVMYLAESAFMGCTNLVTVSWDNDKTVKTIDANHTSPANALAVTSGTTSPFYSLRYQLKHINIYGEQVQDYLFQNFTNVEDVGISSDVKRIGKYAFDGCTSLVDVELYSSNSKLQEIGDRAFRNCPIANNSLYFPHSYLTYIGMDAFLNHNVNKITIYGAASAGINIGENAFKSNTTKEISLSGNIASIGHNAFACPNAETIYYRMSGDTDPYQSSDYAHALFTDCNNVKTLNVNVNFEIKQYTFARMTIEKAEISCKNLTQVTFYQTPIKEVSLTVSQAKDYSGSPFSYSGLTLTSLTFAGSTRIPDYLAYGMRNLTDFNFDATIQSIGKYAFSRTGLSDIVFKYSSSGLRQIDDYAFSGCTSLHSIKCPYSEPPTLGTGVFANCVEDLKTVELIVPMETNYKKADGWKEFYDVYIEYPVQVKNGYRQYTTLSNENNTAIEGSVYYNYTTNTLILDHTADWFSETESDYQYGGWGLSEIIIDQNLMPSSTLTIQLIGDNRMGDGITLGSGFSTPKACNLTISGTGSLLCEGGILMTGGVITFDNLTNCQIGSIMRDPYSNSSFPECEIVVDHSYLTLNTYREGVVDVDNFTLINCEIVSPAGTVFRDGKLYVNDALVPAHTDIVIEPTATGLEEIMSGNTASAAARKVFDPETGNVYILRDGKVYNLQGIEIR
ncbi:MAG: leucine-rich repeat domain-containing protein [Prevotella sp.]|nr:leucine-rich repeat domain-containing protein [Prevotella sp.]